MNRRTKFLILLIMSIALAVGIWIPIFNFAFHGTFSSALATLIAFIGAYAGVLFRKIVKMQT